MALVESICSENPFLHQEEELQFIPAKEESSWKNDSEDWDVGEESMGLEEKIVVSQPLLPGRKFFACPSVDSLAITDHMYNDHLPRTIFDELGKEPSVPFPESTAASSVRGSVAGFSSVKTTSLVSYDVRGDVRSKRGKNILFSFSNFNGFCSFCSFFPSKFVSLSKFSFWFLG